MKLIPPPTFLLHRKQNKMLVHLTQSGQFFLPGFSLLISIQPSIEPIMVNGKAPKIKQYGRKISEAAFVFDDQ